MEKTIKSIDSRVTLRKTKPSGESSNYTNFRHNYGNAKNNTQPGCCHESSGPNAAKRLPHHPGLTPRQRG